MTNITRFPHYHQAENVVTNHVMVMLRMIYDTSPKLLEALIQSLSENELTVGPIFSQQIYGSHSVPDGLILQNPLAIFVETKLGAYLDAEQIKRHCKSITERMKNRTGNFLFALTTGQAGPAVPTEVSEMAEAQGIKILERSFSELVEAIEKLPSTNLQLKDAIQEFKDFIYARGLVPRQNQILVAVLAGTSWRDNLLHGVYYEPADRNQKWQRAHFLGLYHDKQISHVGRIKTSVVGVEDEAGQMQFEPAEMGGLDEEQRQAVDAVTNRAQAYYAKFQTARHRYYIVDKFSETSFRKLSAGGNMGHRYYDIEEIAQSRVPFAATGSDVGRLLDGKTFT